MNLKFCTSSTDSSWPHLLGASHGHDGITAQFPLEGGTKGNLNLGCFGELRLGRAFARQRSFNQISDHSEFLKDNSEPTAANCGPNHPLKTVSTCRTGSNTFRIFCSHKSRVWFFSTQGMNTDSDSKHSQDILFHEVMHLPKASAGCSHWDKIQQS